MLSNKDMHSEINNALEVAERDNATLEELTKVSVKLLTLVIKLLHNVRTNQTIYMEGQGIKLKKPSRISEEKAEE